MAEIDERQHGRNSEHAESFVRPHKSGLQRRKQSYVVLKQTYSIDKTRPPKSGRVAYRILLISDANRRVKSIN